MSKKKQASQQNLSPKKYILTRARSLSIYKCLINNDWLENKTASITITRLHTNGNITAGFYFVDLLARGVRDTHYQFNVPHDDFFEELHQSVPEDFHEEAPYVLVHNIIYGAVSFAEDHHLPPHRDFEITQYILEEDTEEIELLDIEFGENGEPVFIDTDGEDDDEWEDELGDISFEEEDFMSWSDDEWRNYFASEEANNDEHVPAIVNTLFDKWYREKVPFTQQHPAELKESSMRITFDALKKDYHKNEEELIEMKKVYEDLQKSISTRKLNEIEKRLHLMITFNPINPILYNYLALCAQLKNDKQKYLKILNTTIEKFPDYLFSKIALANIFIEQDRITEAETLLGSHYLSGLYPERHTFHFSEFIGFHSTLVRLFVAKNDIQQAVIHYEFLNEFDDEFLETSNIFTKAEQEFLHCKMNVVAT